MEPVPAKTEKAVEAKKQATEEVKAVEQPAPTPPAAAQGYETYTVKDGEDVYAVAIRWGVSPSDLKALNNLTSNELKAGQVLKIPRNSAD